MGWVGPAIQAGGSILGGMAGGKSSGGSKPPKWMRQSTANLGKYGQQLAQTPYSGYGGDRVAGFSPDTLAAFDMIRGNVGAATPAYQTAMNSASDLTGYNAPTVQSQWNPRTANVNTWAGQSLDPYMNPYTNSVINANQADMQNSYLEADNALKSQGAAANAFGNNRFGLAQGQLAADSVRDQSLMSAQLRSQGFNTAAGLLSGDVDRQNTFALANQAAGITADQMGMGGQLANQNASIASAGARDAATRSLGWLGQGYQNMLATDASGLGSVGSAQQALEQQGLDVGYGDYRDQRDWSANRMGLWANSLQPGIGAWAGQQAPTGGGIPGMLGGAQIGSQVGSSIYDWWKNRPQNPYSGGGSYNSYSNLDY
jgi:hypothetical protein